MISRRRALAALAYSCAAAGCGAVDALNGGGMDRSTRIFDLPWKWTDESGAATTFTQFRGTPIVTTGFFSSCTVRCPMTIAKLRDIDANFRARGRPAEVVLVTIDPDTDTVDLLRRLKDARHLPPSWHLLRGSRRDTIEFGRWLHLNVVHDSGHMDHDVRIALLDANGALVDSYDGWNFDQDEMVSALH